MLLKPLQTVTSFVTGTAATTIDAGAVVVTLYRSCPNYNFGAASTAAPPSPIVLSVQLLPLPRFAPLYRR